MKKSQFCKQLDAMDCDSASLSMVARLHGKEYSLEYLRNQSYLTQNGVSMLGISEAAEKIGFRTLAVKVPPEKLVKDAPLPCILHWNQNHFVVLHKINNGWFYIADPGHGLHKMHEKDFLKSWMGISTDGIALLLEPTEQFYNNNPESRNVKKGFSFLFKYLRPYKWYLLQLLLSMFIGSVFSLVFPFLTQALVDKGINKGNIGFVKLVLISQLVLFAGATAIELIRGWMLLHINSRINIAIISDFLIKLMRLPIHYFDTKLIGDIKQRIGDHSRIQSFLTGASLSTAFSMINFVVFIGVLTSYSLKIMGIFLFFSSIGIGWIFLFLKKRKEFDYIRFQRMGDNENVLFELITGMQEIKLNNSETIKRWGWERVQVKLFSLNIKSLALGQYQQIGSSFFNQLKNILISYTAARAVISGNMTLGQMMAVSYIIGQLNSPVQQILGFIQAAQDAKISMDRLTEIHNKDDEEKTGQKSHLSLVGMDKNGGMEHETPISKTIASSNFGSIALNEVSFQYSGLKSPFVLKDVTFEIPQGKVTAIVGTSGSGKTTLMKLLLKYYEPVGGSISIDNNNLQNISPKWWRMQCGIVMQEGYVFSDTIAGNIAMSDENPNHERLRQAVQIANIKGFIDELPMNYNTKIGNSGNGIIPIKH